MTKNLIHSLKDDLTPELCETISARVGEDTEAVFKSLESVLPLLVGNLARHVTEVAQIDGLYAMIVDSDAADCDVPRLAAKLRSDNGPALFADGQLRANQLLGARAATIADAETALAALRPESARDLVGLAMVLVLSELKRELVAHQLNADGLTYFLMSQKAVLGGQIDPSLATALGYRDPAALIAGIASVPEANDLEPSFFRSLLDLLRRRTERLPMPGDVRGPDTLQRGADGDTLIRPLGADAGTPPARPDKTLH